MAKISEMSMKNFQITKKLNIRKQVIFTALNFEFFIGITPKFGKNKKKSENTNM